MRQKIALSAKHYEIINLDKIMILKWFGILVTGTRAIFLYETDSV